MRYYAHTEQVPLNLNTYPSRTVKNPIAQGHYNIRILSNLPRTAGTALISRRRQPSVGTPKRRPRARRSVLGTVLLSGVAVIFAVGGLFFGFVFLVTISGLFIQLPSPTIPFISTNPPTDSVQAPDGSTLQPGEWVGTDRITILLLGIDQRPDERGKPTRSDTIMLLTVNPANNTSGLLSIPRDLWVPIPGHESNKINTAHFFGELNEPGKGPETVRKTIEHNFGVKVNYFARVDFEGFERLIDAIGGITVDVRRPIKDDEYPDDQYGIIRIFLPAGVQQMDGPTALQFARSRHSESDFGRIRRQQEVMIAARNRALQVNVIPKIPQLIGIFSEAVVTDIPAHQMIAMTSLAGRIEPNRIVRRAIDHTMVMDVNRDGSVLVPDREKIRKVIMEVFDDSPANTPTAVATATAVSAPVQALPSPTEGSLGRRIRVLNGTSRNQFAAMTAEALENRDFQIVAVEQADRSDYARTIIMVAGPRVTEAQEITKLLSIPDSAIRTNQLVGDGADITIILGFNAAVP